MEIEKFTAKKNESQTKKEQEKSSVFNSYPSTGNPFEKSPTFSKKNNSQKEDLYQNKISGLGTLRKTLNDLNNLKYQIHWIDNFENSEKEKCQTYSILLDLPEICTVKDCIVMSINELNKILEKKDISYSLIDNPKHYELFISKKNGMPKEDYPSYDYELLITATKNLSFTLMHRNDEVFLTKEIKKSLIFHPEKNLQFYEKEINPKEKKNIIVLDDSENIEFNNSFFCFCFSSKKKKKNLPDKLL